MKITKKIITLPEAIKISPDYVSFINGDWDKFNSVLRVFEKLKKGQKVLTFSDNKFVIAKVSSVNTKDIRAVDEAIVRVSNGEYSWRVDGDKYAWPI